LEEPLPNTTTINVNDQRGAITAMRYFINHQCSRIAFVAGPANSISGQRRLEGYRAGLKEADLVFDAQLVEFCAPTLQGGEEAAHNLLTRFPDIDAIYAFNDLTAIGALQAVQKAGKVVPDDVVIIGADDIYLTDLIHPTLTTLHVNLVHIGRTAMRTLIDIIQLGASSAAIKIEPQLIRRESA